MCQLSRKDDGKPCLILESPNGTEYILVVDNDGVLSTTMNDQKVTVKE